MKNKWLITALIALSSITGFAAESGGHGGSGGDPNEISFNEIANNIRGWIESGNADTIVLPPGVSLDTYKTSMMKALSNYRITFTSLPVLVDGHEKTCRNWIESDGVDAIECSSTRFPSAPADLKFEMVHHEFAGLAGLERSATAKSKYALSSQISARLEDTVVKRLPVIPSKRVDPKIPYVSYEPSVRLSPFFPRTNLSSRVLPMACSRVNRSEIQKDFFARFTQAFIKDFTEKTGLRVISYQTAFHLGGTKSIRVDDNSGPNWTLALAHAGLNLKLENGNALAVYLASNMANFQDQRGFFNIGLSPTEKIDTLGNVVVGSVGCEVISQLGDITVLNPTTQTVIYKQNSGIIVSFPTDRFER